MSSTISSNAIVTLSIFIPMIVFMHLLVYNIQFISNKQYFYGVYIKNIELDEKDKKRIDKEYKRKMNVMLLITILLFVLNSTVIKYNTDITLAVLIILYTVASFIYLKKYYDEVKLLKSNILEHMNVDKSTTNVGKKKIIVDTELVNAKSKLKKKFTILFSICLGLSILSFIYLAINYNKLPDTIATHWGFNGEADGFSEKNIVNVFTVSIIDIFLVLLMSYMGVASIGSRIYIDTNDLENNRKKAIKYLNGIGYSFLFLTLSIQLMTTTTPIFLVNQINIPMILMLQGMILPIVISIALVYFYIMLGTVKSKDKSINSIESDDEKWLYGFIYYNKEDPSFMVEKRFGAGWTVNVANPKGKILIAVTVIMILGSFMLPFMG